MKFTASIFALAIAATQAFAPQLLNNNAFVSRTPTALNAAVTAALVKELRQRTGSGMMDCKKALVNADGDIEKAIEDMRTSGAVKAVKKAGKVASEGRIIIKSGDGSAAVVEVNCQTDFVAKDPTFQAFANKVAETAAESMPEIAELKEIFEEERIALVAKIGENIDVRRVRYVKGELLSTYLHGNGNIGVIIAGSGDEAILKNMGMHVAALSPQYLSVDDVPADVVEKESQIQLEIAMNEGKPAAIAEKMVSGRMRKFSAEISLKGQGFVMEPKKTVEEVLKEKNSDITEFVRLQVGEGIEKKEEMSFADEVASMSAGN